MNHKYLSKRTKLLNKYLKEHLPFLKVDKELEYIEIPKNFTKFYIPLRFVDTYTREFKNHFSNLYTVRGHIVFLEFEQKREMYYLIESKLTEYLANLFKQEKLHLTINSRGYSDIVDNTHEPSFVSNNIMLIITV